MSNPNEVKHIHKFYQKDEAFMRCDGCEMEIDGEFYIEYLNLVEKCKNLDSIIDSLDVRDPNACDALLNVQLINQKTIHELKLENKALRDMYDGTQIVLSEVRAELSTANKKAEKLVEALLTIIGVHTQAYASVVAENALKKYRGEK